MKRFFIFVVLLLSINLVFAISWSGGIAESNLNVNSSEIWITNVGDLDDVNDTQFDGGDGDTLNIKESWLTSFGNNIWCALTGCEMSGDLNLTANLDVEGNATFYGPFETSCLHCDGNDTYFHGDGFFEGNITAPNIEVLESLIVRGNSSCSGSADKCNTFSTASTCGGFWSGQRGCFWLFGSCLGTETACENMPLATCEDQHTCTLTTSGSGFIFGADGFTGNFSINTTGNITGSYGFFDNLKPDTNASTECVLGEYLDGGSDCYDLNNTIDERTKSITYLPISVNEYGGTLDSGNYTDVWVGKDGLTVNVSEDTGADPIFTVFNFTNVSDINQIVIRIWYDGSAGHEINPCLYDYNEGGYECEYGMISDMDGFAFFSANVLDATDHIDSGNSSLAFKHKDNGNPSHNIFYDYVSLVDGFSTITGQETDPFFEMWLANPILEHNLNMSGNNISDVGWINTTNLQAINIIVGGDIIASGINLSNINNEYINHSGYTTHNVVLSDGTIDYNLTADDITAGDNFFASMGLVSSPSYSFTVSPTTGMYLNPSGADNLLLVTDGAIRVDIDSICVKLNVPLNMDSDSISNVDDLGLTGTIDFGINTIADEIMTGDWSLSGGDIVTTGLGRFGNLDVDTLNLNGNVISDSTGTISFSNEILATIGSVDINQGGVAGYHGLSLTTDVTTTATTGLPRNYVNYFNVNPSGNNNVDYITIQGLAITPTTNTRDFAKGMYGLHFTSQFRGQGTLVDSVGALIGGFGNANTGILTEAIGVLGDAGGLGTGKVTDSYVFLAQPFCTSTGAGYCTNSYSFYLNNAFMTTNSDEAYGVYLEDVDYGDTLNYAVYTVGGNNYFGGADDNFTIAGKLATGTNTLDDLNTGDINVSIVNADAYVTKSPFILCDGNYCEAHQPQYKLVEYFERDNDWNIVSDIEDLSARTINTITEIRQDREDYSDWLTIKTGCEDDTYSYPTFIEYKTGNRECYLNQEKVDDILEAKIEECEFIEWQYWDSSTQTCEENIYWKCVSDEIRDWDFGENLCVINPQKECEIQEDMIYVDGECVFSQEKQDERLIRECIGDRRKYFDLSTNECVDASSLK